MAENLQHWLANYTILSEAQEVPASQAAAIYAAVTNLLLDDKEIVGLNYSGGTKTMAVHAQLALRDKLGLAALPHLSYLDSRALRMRFDDGTSVKVGQSLQVDLETDLMQLHKGLQLDLNNPPTRFAILPRTARAVAMMWADKAEREAWQAWLHGELGRYQLRRSTFNKERQRWQNWASEAQLRQVQISFPPVVGELMREELVLCGYPAENSHLDLGLSYDCLYRRDVHSSVEDLCAWFWSKWLEQYVFVCLDGLRSEFGFHSILMGVETSPMRFEVDVVALRGYQLCAFSCSTTYRHDTLKLKLFEAVVRARQLGGDEVRIALVCTNFRRRACRKSLRIRLIGVLRSLVFMSWRHCNLRLPIGSRHIEGSNHARKM